MNPVVRFLNFWAGADNSVLRHCPRHERQKYTSIGALVLLTGVYASMASGYAFFVVFDSLTVAIALGTLWGLFILNLDRLMLTTFPKSDNFGRQLLHAVPRLILALAIGITIAHPLVLRLFAEEILSKIAEENDQKKTDLLQKKGDRLKAAFADFQIRIQGMPEFIIQSQLKIALDNAIVTLKNCDANQEEAQKRASCEADGSCGSGSRGAKEIYLVKQKAADELATRCNILRDNLKESRQKLDAASQIFTQESKKAEADFHSKEDEIELNYKLSLQHLSSQKAAFLRKSEVLANLSGPAANMRLAVSVLFVLVEIVPVFVKIISPRDSTDELYKAIHDAFRQRISELAKSLSDPGSIPITPTEEEPSIAGAVPEETTGATNALRSRIIATIVTICITATMLIGGASKSEAFEAGTLFIAAAALVIESAKRARRK